MNYFYVLAIFLTLSSCEIIDELTQFNLDYDKEVTVDANTIIEGTATINTDPIETDIENNFKINNVSKDNVIAIIPKGLILKLKTPKDLKLDFLNSVSAYIVADGLPETKVAWKNSIPENINRELVLDISEKNLKAYLDKDEFYFKIEVSSNRVIKPEIKLELASKFLVKATVIK